MPDASVDGRIINEAAALGADAGSPATVAIAVSLMVRPLTPTPGTNGVRPKAPEPSAVPVATIPPLNAMLAPAVAVPAKVGCAVSVIANRTGEPPAGGTKPN